MTVPKDTSANTGGSEKEPKRRPYQKPDLLVYGDLTKITQTVRGSNAADGGSQSNKHFTS